MLIQPRPGTDGAIALAVSHLLVANGWLDRAYIERHVRGFDEFRALVATRTPAWAAEVSGVPERQILKLAEWIGTRGPVTICAGFGMQRFTNSGQTMRAMIAALALTGNIGKPGAGWVFANLRTQVFGATKDPIDFYPPAASGDAVRVSISTALLGRSMLATEDPRLRIAWVERGNPIPQNPETPSVLRAFRALDFRVVVDEFLTDTAREADIVLPAKSLFEQTDVIGAYWHDYLQLRQKAIDPPGEVKPETEIYWRLAHRLGFEPAAIAEHLPGPSDAAIDAYLEARLAQLPGITLARLREGPVRAPGAVDVAFADVAFPTPSGKIEILSDEARTSLGRRRAAGLRRAARIRPWRRGRPIAVPAVPAHAEHEEPHPLPVRQPAVDSRVEPASTARHPPDRRRRAGHRGRQPRAGVQRSRQPRAPRAAGPRPAPGLRLGAQRLVAGGWRGRERAVAGTRD